MDDTANHNESASAMELLIAIRERARRFFEHAREVVAPPEHHTFMVRPTDYWQDLPKPIMDQGYSVVAELAELAHVVGPMIRRSPLLTQADEREAGNAIKGMRAAIRFRRFQRWETEILHDEDRVLGVRPEHESVDQTLHPIEARLEFERYADALQTRLELTNPNLDNSPDLNLPSSAKPIAAGYRPGTCFIIMWMDKNHPELIDVSNTVKRCFEEFNVAAVRSDDIEHEEVITQRILDEIKTAEFLFADLTGERPSVYYEVGYAHALGRRVIMYRKEGTSIHFDLAAYNCPEYKNFSELEEKLMKRLESVTGKLPKKRA